MLLNSGVNFGIKRSVPHYLGICLGFPTMVLMVALGFGTLFLTYTWLKDVLKVIGCLYMLYLSWRIMFAATNNNTKTNALKPFSFLQAVCFQWINPKAWLMAISAISIFTLAVDYFHNALAISTILLLTCLPCLGIWLLFGAILQKILKQEKYQKWFNRLMGACLAISTIMIFIDT
jgi:threonine/homoserine/homoserine lactone efflux protein